MRMVALCQVIVLATALGCTAMSARAQTTPPDSAGAPAGPPGQLQEEPDRSRTGDAAAPVAIPRFSLQRVDGGYLRLDAQSGSVAYCAPRDPTWNCESASDDRTGAEKQVVCTPHGDPGWNCQALNVDRAALEKEISRLQGDVTSLKQDFERRHEEVASLKQDVEQRQAAETSLKQEFDRRQEEVKSLKQEVERRRDEVATLKQEVERRGAEIASLKQEVERRRAEVGSLNQKVERHREEVASLKQEVSSRQEEITTLTREGDRRREEVALLKQEIVALRAPPPAAPPPDASESSDLTIKLPSRDDLARAGTYLQDTARGAWDRLVDMITHFQQDVMRKS